MIILHNEPLDAPLRDSTRSAYVFLKHNFVCRIVRTLARW